MFNTLVGTRATPQHDSADCRAVDEISARISTSYRHWWVSAYVSPRYAIASISTMTSSGTRDTSTQTRAGRVDENSLCTLRSPHRTRQGQSDRSLLSRGQQVTRPPPRRCVRCFRAPALSEFAVHPRLYRQSRSRQDRIPRCRGVTGPYALRVRVVVSWRFVHDDSFDGHDGFGDRCRLRS